MIAAFEVSAPVVWSLGAASIICIFLALVRLPRHGEVTRGSRPFADSLFHLGLGILSIGLLGLSSAARVKLPLLEPFRSNRVLLEIACAAASIMAVSPLLAILGTGLRREGETTKTPQPLPAAMGGGMLRFAIIFIPLQALEWCVLRGFKLNGLPTPPQDALLQFQEAAWPVRLAMILGISMGAAVAEETVFRGTLQPAMARFIGAGPARIVVSALFGALHGPVAALPIGIFGYFLARIRDAWGRLLPCMAIHAANNLIALLLFAEVPYIRELYN